MNICDATPKDAQTLTDIAFLAKAHWSYPKKWLTLWRESLTVTPEYISLNEVWIAQADSVIAGFIAISIDKNSIDKNVANLEHLWVKPSDMKKGIGKKLLLFTIAKCRKKGISLLRIESDPNAKMFYEKFGGKLVGMVKSCPSPRVLPVLEIDI
ncbi:MAG: GNAT family N-acetyltransferase [Gammaproteobacteria bacterium]|nr:GNAT family N-acetyltransferase [Gammaproteobacteria bacterium]